MHTYSSVFLHVVFGTKNHHPFLSTAVRPNVHAYLAGICRNLGIDPYVIGGVEDHVHLLVRQSMTLCIADFLEKLKANSSKWIHPAHPELKRFGWQRGYAAFSVSYSALSRVRAYIERQEEHHRTRSFREELEEFLRHCGVPIQDDDLTA